LDSFINQDIGSPLGTGGGVLYSHDLGDDDTGRILGANMVGHGAKEVIHLFAFAMKHNVTAAETGGSVFAYPTFTSDLKFLV